MQQIRLVVWGGDDTETEEPVLKLTASRVKFLNSLYAGQWCFLFKIEVLWCCFEASFIE